VKLLQRIRERAGLRVAIVVVVAATALGLALVSRSRRPPVPVPEAPRGTPPTAPAVAAVTLPPAESPPLVTYHSTGRRDPFRPPRAHVAPREPSVNLKVTGIVRGPHAVYALVEPEPSDGKGYVIRENDVVDSARVFKITAHGVVFEIKTTSATGQSSSRFVRKPLGP